MLYDVDQNEHTEMIHSSDYDRWRRRLSDEDHQRVIAALHQIMNENDIFKSSYLPGTNWNGTPYQPIYYAVGESEIDAALFYGLLVWEAVQQHMNEWYFIKQQESDDQPTGMTYFRRSSN